MQRSLWYRVQTLFWYCGVAVRKEFKRRGWFKVLSIASPLYFLFGLLINVENPLFSWSKRTRAIILLSSLVVILLLVIEALYQFHKRRTARLKLRHKSTVKKIKDGYKSKIQALDERRKREVGEAQQERNKVRAELSGRIEELEGEKAALGIARKEDAKRIRDEENNNANTYRYLETVKSALREVSTERNALKAQLEERNKQRLFLFVDTEKGFPNPSDPWERFQSKASLYRDSITFNLAPNEHPKSTRFMLWADFVIFFENRSSERVSIRTVKVLLLRKTSRGREKEIQHRNAMPIEVKPITSAPLTLDGWPIEDMTITPPLILNCKLTLSGRIGERLDQNCFFRISVDAISHPEINVDLDVDWEKARGKEILVPITPRKSAQYLTHKFNS